MDETANCLTFTKTPSSPKSIVGCSFSGVTHVVQMGAAHSRAEPQKNRVRTGEAGLTEKSHLTKTHLDQIINIWPC